MGDVLQFGDGRRRDAPILRLRDELAATGNVSQRLGEGTVSVEEWRKAARATRREFGRPVQTLAGADAVHAVLKDWPRDDRERAIHTEALKAAMLGATLEVETLELIPPCPGCGSGRRCKPGRSIEETGSTVCDSCGLVEVSSR